MELYAQLWFGLNNIDNIKTNDKKHCILACVCLNRANHLEGSWGLFSDGYELAVSDCGISHDNPETWRTLPVTAGNTKVFYTSLWPCTRLSPPLCCSSGGRVMFQLRLYLADHRSLLMECNGQSIDTAIQNQCGGGGKAALSSWRGEHFIILNVINLSPQCSLSKSEENPTKLPEHMQLCDSNVTRTNR